MFSHPLDGGGEGKASAFLVAHCFLSYLAAHFAIFMLQIINGPTWNNLFSDRI